MDGRWPVVFSKDAFSGLTNVRAKVFFWMSGIFVLIYPINES